MPTAPAPRAANLRTQGLTPLVVEPAGTPHARRAPAAAVARTAAVAARAGDSHAPARQPADRGPAARRALAVLTEQSERDYIRELMAAIRAEVLGGHSFANALDAASARLSRDLSRAGGGRRTDRQARTRAVAPRRLHRAAQRAEAEDRARVHLSGDRHGDRVRHRHVPGELRRAAGRERVRQHQAAAAVPHHHDDGALRLRAQLLVGGADRRGVLVQLDREAHSRAARPAHARSTGGCSPRRSRQARARLQHRAFRQHARRS